MAKVGLFFILFALVSCNVANQPVPLSAAGVTTTDASMSFNTVSLTRNEGIGVVSVVLQLSKALSEDAEVSFSVTGTATGGAACTAGIDFISPTSPVVFPAGTRTTAFDIPICADSLYEGNESFYLTLTGSTPSMSLGSIPMSTINLIDAATPPPILFTLASGGSITEGNTGDSTIVPVDVQLNYPSAFPVTVTILASGTGTDGVDYSLTPTSVTFAPGTTVQTVFVTVLGDDYVELNETVVLSLFNPFGGVIGSTPSHTIQIADDETPNPITITNIGFTNPIAENAGTVNMDIQINGITDHEVTFQYAVNSGGGITGGNTRAFYGSDFVFPGFAATTGQITIPAFTTGAFTVPVAIVNDSIFEGPESAVISLIGGPEVAVTGTADAELFIADNDTQPTLTFEVAGQTVEESNTVRSIVVRYVNASGVEVPVGTDTDITLSTTDITTNVLAPARVDWRLGLPLVGADYTLTIPANASRAVIPFTAIVDAIDENTESFSVSFNSTGGFATGTATHTVQILDIDAPAKLNFTAASSTAINEGAVTFDISTEFDALTEKAVDFTYSIAGVDASTVCAGSADVAGSGTVSIAANSLATSTNITLTVCDDLLYEGDETMLVNFRSVTNAALGSLTSHSVVLQDNIETPPALSVAAGAANYDEDAGTATFMVTVGATARPFTFSYATSGTAIIGTDHNLPVTGIVNVPASAIAQNFPISFSITNDTSTEDAETVIMTIAASTVDATIGTATDTITINASDALQLAVGRTHTCGMLNGRVKCWGEGVLLGNGSLTDYGDAVGETVTGLQNISLGTGFVAKKIVAGDHFTCALSTTGVVKCWGLNSDGQLGQGTRGVAATSSEYIGDAVAEMGNNLVAVPLGGGVIDIETSAMANHVCALYSSKRMKCWGLNASGQLGISFTGSDCTTDALACQGDDFGEVAALNYLTFPNLPGVLVERIAVGANHTCAQLSNDTVHCWGLNTNGVLGVDSADTHRYLHYDASVAYASAVAFNAAFDVSNMLSLTAGDVQTCATFDNGVGTDAICWGQGTNGELGLGTNTNIGTAVVGESLAALATPINYSPFSTLTGGIKPGNNFACLRAASAAAQVYCWGDNAFDVLGSAGGPNTNAPQVADVLGPYTDVYVGSTIVCAVSGGFRYTCWGNNANGSAGAESATNITSPGAPRLFQ